MLKLLARAFQFDELLVGGRTCLAAVCNSFEQVVSFKGRQERLDVDVVEGVDLQNCHEVFSYLILFFRGSLICRRPAQNAFNYEVLTEIL